MNKFLRYRTIASCGFSQKYAIQSRTSASLAREAAKPTIALGGASVLLLSAIGLATDQEGTTTRKNDGTTTRGNLASWLSQQTKVHAWPLPGKRFDIGDLESYKKVDEVFGGKVHK